MTRKQFIKEIEKVYTNNDGMLKLFDTNSIYLGHCLKVEEIEKSFTLQEILSANSLEELKNKAKIIKKRVDLYNIWEKEFKK